MELRFTVWQFVRLMVHLEEGRDHDADHQSLLTAWQDVWSDLDETLARLAAEDPDAYSALMMDQDVVIADATAKQTQTACQALKDVMAQMDEAIGKEAEKDLLDSLKFERRELRQLTRKLDRAVADKTEG